MSFISKEKKYIMEVVMSEYRFPAVDYDKQKNLLDIFIKQSLIFDKQPFLWNKRQGMYKSWSWSLIRNQAANLSHHLILEGKIKSGDRIVLTSENRPEWIISDLAILGSGAIPTPSYPTNTENDQIYILNNVQATIVIVSGGKTGNTMLQAASKAKKTPIIFLMDRTNISIFPKNLKIFFFDELNLSKGNKDFPNISKNIGIDDLSTIIHTSGTGGMPKGVMLSHRAIIHNCMGAYHLLKNLKFKKEKFFIFFTIMSFL